MPELPEVETITNSLNELLSGAEISEVHVYDRLRNVIDEAELRRHCAGQKICRFSRRAKFIRAVFGNATGLILHLGMTGSFSVTPDDGIPQRHERIAWTLRDGRRWRFFDIRKFGALFCTDHNPELDLHPALRDLGPEPLGDKFTPKYLQQILAKHNSPVKNLILDQHLLVGVGNIYASEALFKAGISPLRPGDSLSLADCRTLHQAIREILAASIRAGGTTISDYRDVDGSRGKFVNQLQVYGRTGEPCPKCHTPVVRKVMAGRSTFYCPNCQK